MKQRVSYFAIGLFVGLIIGFTVTNYLNRPEFAPGRKSQTAAQGAPVQGASQQQQQPANPHGDMLAEVTPEQVQKVKAQADANPQSYTDQLMCADILLKLQNLPADAIAYYERASKLKPEEAKPLVGLGDATLATAESPSGVDTAVVDKAAGYYERALAIDPKSVEANTHLGVTHLVRTPAEPDKAIDRFKRSLEIDPKHALTLIYYTRALTDKGDYAGAEQMIATLASVDPRSPAVGQLRENIAHARGDHPPHGPGEGIPTH